MDTTIISVLATGAGTVMAVVGLVSRSIGNLRSHMDHRIDALTHANQQAHDAIGLRIDNVRNELVSRIDAQGAELRTELGGRIDAQGADLRERIDAQGAELRERIDTQGAELRERIDTQGAELRERIDTQGAELRERIDAQGKRLDRVEVKVSRMGEDVAFIKGWVTAQPEA